MKISKPYGTWPSPITPQVLSQRLHLEDVQWDSDGQTLVWLQGRSDRSVLVAQCGDDAPRELTDSHSLHGGVGYGGGEFQVSQGQIYFADRSGRLFHHSLAYGQPEAVTPPYGGAASPVLSPDGRRVVYVFSDGSTDLLGLVDAEGRDWPVKLVQGADFYMQPAWSPDGKWLAWVEWNHPNMPWDGTSVKLARFVAFPPRVEDIRVVAGSSDLPASQPIFSPDGRWLALIEFADEWDNLVLIDLLNGSRRVCLTGDGYHLSTPDWTQGQRTLAWSHDSQGLFSIRNFAGACELYWIRLDGAEEKLDTGAYTSFSQISASPTSRQVAMIASSPILSTRIVRWSPQGMRVIARSDSETLDPAWLPVPQAIQWHAPDGSPVHGLFYPPTSPTHTAAGLPPAIFHIHGGPTSHAGMSFSGEIAYFTSRGYAVVEINYRGSSGYGRSYRDALRSRWGQIDVEDAVSCQQALSDREMISARHSIIKGGSAGGYTVLNALVRHPGVFKAGVCLYGVQQPLCLRPRYPQI